MNDNNNVARFTYRIILFMCFSFSQYLYSISVQCIENPKPTHFEGNFKTLVVINEISSDFSEKDFMVSLFHNFFVDKDDENIFYLFPGGTFKKQIVLYQLNLQGQLLEVLCIDRKKYGPLQVLAKRNGLFWAISRNGDIKILKKR